MSTDDFFSNVCHNRLTGQHDYQVSQSTSSAIAHRAAQCCTMFECGYISNALSFSDWESPRLSPKII